jgi:formylglycine-generating enzyme required for sulfatase activity
VRPTILFAIAGAACGGTTAAPSLPAPTPAPPPPPRSATTASTAPPPAASDCPAGMVHVPAGSFEMGSPDGTGRPNERPQHTVTLSAFCIDRTEVTVAAYAACVAKGTCAPAPTTTHDLRDAVKYAQYDQFCNGDRSDRQDHPINCIDWNQAKAYCVGVGKRLPTEAEWEYAARGKDQPTYPWGDDPPQPRRLNACGTECVAMAARLQLDPAFHWTSLFDGDDGWESTAPVGSYPDGASTFGVLDMAGNVWEWTADGYGLYGSDAVTNPVGPSDRPTRVFRGGGWYVDGANAVRGAVRFNQGPTYRRDDLGVRCVRED